MEAAYEELYLQYKAIEGELSSTQTTMLHTQESIATLEKENKDYKLANEKLLQSIQELEKVLSFTNNLKEESLRTKEQAAEESSRLLQDTIKSYENRLDMIRVQQDKVPV